jgi:hypothetical protein
MMERSEEDLRYGTGTRRIKKNSKDYESGYKAGFKAGYAKEQDELREEVNDFLR